MHKILVVTGSVRPGNVGKKVTAFVQKILAAKNGVEVSVADLGELNLPFYDAPLPPSADEFAHQHDSVTAWSELVQQADAVVFVAPEYNHSLSALQKNAIDWLYKEWNDKPVTFVGYGWYGGAHALTQFEEIGTVVKWQLGARTAELKFTKDIDVSGESLGASGEAALTAVLDELVAAL